MKAIIALLGLICGMVLLGAPPVAVKGTSLSFANTDIVKVSGVWQRMYGETVTVAERAKSLKVSLKVTAPSKEELRPILTKL